MISVLEDRRIMCTSVMTAMSVRDYLERVERAYQAKGGIDGQRTALKTKTATTIRKRLVSDLTAGAVIPPIVIGLIVSAEMRRELGSINKYEEFFVALRSIDADSLSIIDGMQRTTALKEASRTAPAILDAHVRVEFWIAEYVNSLIYRMLVLNTGQVPWDLSRQLETIYGQLLKQVKSVLGSEDVKIFLKNDSRRRADAGQYQSNAIVELLLIFSSRREDVELRDKIAEDFAKLDAIESSAHKEFVEYFIDMLKLMVRLDRAFSRLQKSPADGNSRFDSGKDIFGSLPAMAGFAAAVAISIFDEPGFQIDWNSAPDRLKAAIDAINALVERIDAFEIDQLREFMQLDLLQEILSGRRGGVGRHEREVFKKAFIAMIKNSDRLVSLTPCWRAS